MATSAPQQYHSTPVLDRDTVPNVASNDQSGTPSEDKDVREDDSTLEDGKSGITIAAKSKGVVEMESLKERLTTKRLAIIYGFFCVLAYILSLNQYSASVFLTQAVSRTFGKHALQATISTITAVFQAMSQPPIAKFADVFGRIPAYLGCVFFYCLGYIIVASSNGIVTYAVGNSIYIIGITGLFLLQNVIISDISSLRNRWWWTIAPSILQCINGFIIGDFTDSFLSGDGGNQWRWGFGIFVILIPVLAAPIVITLYINMRPSRVLRAELKAAREARRQANSFQVRLVRGVKSFFWQLDFIGLFLFVVGFGLFFVTITTANSRTARWSDAHSIAQLVVGGVLIIAFVLWERYGAPHPLLPFALLRRKTVLGCCLVALFHPMCGRIVGGYLYTFLIVAAGQSQKSAANIQAYPTVAGTVTGIVGSMLARKLRTLKWFIVFGLGLELLANGLMIRYRTSTNSQAELAIVQLLRGAANGFIPFPTQALIQAASPHEHLAGITSAWLVVYYLSGGIGSAISGSIWTNTIISKINTYVAQAGGNETMAAMAYQNPLGYADLYPLHSPMRDAIARAQDEAQRIIVIVGVCVTVLGFASALFLLSDLRLTDDQSLEESETSITEEERKFKAGRKGDKA